MTELNQELGRKNRDVAQGPEMSYISTEVYNMESHVPIIGIYAPCHKNLNMVCIRYVVLVAP